MNILTRIKNLISSDKRSVIYAPVNALGLPYGFPTAPLSIGKSLQISAVYRCTDLISSDIASQSWDVLVAGPNNSWEKDEFHQCWELLNLIPSPTMNKFNLMKTMVAKILLEGEANIVIHRDGTGNPVELELITDTVKVYKRADRSLYYEIGKPGNSYVVEDENLIRVIGYSYDGILGVSVLTHAANSVSLSYSAEASARGFFASGANASGFITSEGNLTKEQSDAIKETWKTTFDVSTGDPGGIAVLGKSLKFEKITVNPKDAQLLEIRGFNVVDICRFFGVPPQKAFDQANQTYSNVEAYQLAYITDTIYPMNLKIMNEFNRKLFLPSKRKVTWLELNIRDLMAANSADKSNYLSKMFQIGGYTVNEVRRELGNPAISGGDQAYYPTNMNLVGTKPENKINSKTEKK